MFHDIPQTTALYVKHGRTHFFLFTTLGVVEGYSIYFNLIRWLVYLVAVTAKDKVTVFRTVDTMPLISE
jgi:hypothetical protein